MSIRKTNLRYFFSVEGETEKWYLDYLQNLINEEPTSAHRVSFDSKVEKDPLKRVKRLNIISKTEITHFFDYESNDQQHRNQFLETLDLLKKASKLGKQVKYNLGYSNFTFELWIILHKSDCNRCFTHRRQYLEPINRAFGENFSEMGQYKQQTNFNRVLKTITLNDVKKAIERAKTIMQNNKENGYTLQQYKGYRYYKENPSLSIWESIEKILIDCKLLN